MQDWKGHLVVDDYVGYKALFAGGVIEVGCMAHARRKFFELHKANQSPVAGDALQRIAELYAIETRGRELANIERRDLREREALPKLQAMQEWLQRTRDSVADGGGLVRLWTDAPNGKFDSEGISTLIEKAANKVIWRLEGKPETGLSAVVSCAGSEIAFNLQRDRVDEVVAKAAEAGKKCEEAAQRTQDAGEQLALHAAFGIVGCVGALLASGAAGAGPAALAAVACYAAYDQWQQEADEVNKKAREDAMERDRLRCGYADTGGGGGMGGIRYTRNMG